MKLGNIVQRETDFGTFHTRKNFFIFALKCILYIIPAIIIGNYTDISIQRIQQNKLLGDNTFFYILLQTIIILLTLYIILLLFTSYTNEFQITIAGGFFGVLYFGMQPNYTDMIKDYINS